MILRGIAKRYAVALFDAAAGQEIAEQVNDDVVAFSRLLDTNADFRGYLASPQVLTEDKQRLIAECLGDRAAGLFVRFLLLLIEKKRLEHFGEIADAYVHLFEQLQGILEVKVVTAVELDSDLEQKTIEKLERETGKTVRLVRSVDPGVIGGMILVLNDQIIDGSIRHQLEELRRSLGSARVH